MKKIIIFIRSVFEEAKKVEWLKPKELAKYSWMVVAFIVLATTLLALFDYALITFRSYITSDILL